MKITVSVFNMYKSRYIVLDDEKNEATFNGKKVELDIPPFASKLLTIISSWDNRMVNDMVLDGESYSVKVEKDGKVYNYEGRNKFPLNYRDFIDLLRDNNLW